MIDFSDLLGMPFKMLEHNPESGKLSCVGLALEIDRRMGRKPIDPSIDPDGAEAQREVVKPPFQVGDWLAFSMRGGVLPTHVGILVDGGAVLHSVDPEGVVLTPFSVLRDKVKVAYRWKTPST